MPSDERRGSRLANEVLVWLVAAPLAANLAQRLAGGQFATSKGALAMLAGPPLFGAGIFALTRMHWAAWMALVIDALLLAIVGIGDVAVAHAFPARLVVAAIALALAGWRIARLTKLQATQARG